jgi:hypothetical protein
VTFEGNRWYEDGDGRISEVSKRKAIRYFDANYLATLAKAVPELEELELVGQSNDGIVSSSTSRVLSINHNAQDALTSSLQRFHHLHTLIISGPATMYTPKFFRSSVAWSQYEDMDMGQPPDGPYAPQSLEEALYDLGNGCRTLEQIRVSNHLGELFHEKDTTATIIRDGPAGPVKDLKIRKGWGRLIGREDEW